jgi:hypothetical protein
VSLTPSYPRGNVLTEWMPFTDDDGVYWLVYIEGVPQPSRPRPWSRVTLPGRRLRFDSDSESRFTLRVPAGAPFLADARLHALLAEAQPVPPAASNTGSSRGAIAALGRPVAEWATRAAESGREAVADLPRRWRQTANRRQALRRRARELASGASETLHDAVENVLGGPRARR